MLTARILVIDDEYRKFDYLLEEHLSMLSKENGLCLEMTFCESREQAANLMSHAYDLVLMDLFFGGGACDNAASFAFLTELREMYPDVPVVVLSNSKDTEDLLQIGFRGKNLSDGFLEKSHILDDMNYQELYSELIRTMMKYGRIGASTGIIFTHGTDTMPWAFAILRYGLRDLSTNVVLTGSQLPLEGTFSPSDAIGNMLTSVKVLNKLVPPNIVQVFNDGVHVFNKNLNKVKKWSFDAFCGNSFAHIEHEQLKVDEDDVTVITKENKLDMLHFIQAGGTIDSVKGTEGLAATGDFTGRYISELGISYFSKFQTHKINPKDSSLFNPEDWTKALLEIQSTGLAKADIAFDWRIMPILTNPFMDKVYYDQMADLLTRDYSGAIILGYGAGNVNIFGSDKTDNTRQFALDFQTEFGKVSYAKQAGYSLIPFLKRISDYNINSPDDYKFVVMSSQVPIDSYDIDYQAGQIPLYYGALPSCDHSYPEAQTKLAFILGHRDLILRTAQKYCLTYEQVVKSCYLAGTSFLKKENEKVFLSISSRECRCPLIVYPKNLFVKGRFEEALQVIVERLCKLQSRPMS